LAGVRVCARHGDRADCGLGYGSRTGRSDVKRPETPHPLKNSLSASRLDTYGLSPMRVLPQLAEGCSKALGGEKAMMVNAAEQNRSKNPCLPQ
jgi:hypothetical protein